MISPSLEQVEFNNARELGYWLIERKACRIAVDGMNGAGKSYLSCRIAEQLKGFHLPLDRFINGGGIDDYVRHLDTDRLNAAFGALNHRPVIFDSLLVLDVLEKMGISADAHIYLKLVNPIGDGVIWHDDDMHDPNVEFAGGGVLDPQRRSYNLKWAPATRADAIFLRQED